MPIARFNIIVTFLWLIGIDCHSSEVTDDEVFKPHSSVLEEVYVTGSKLDQGQGVNILSTYILSSSTNSLAGLSSSESVIQSVPFTRGAQITDQFNTLVTSHGAGASTISLLGLGSARTLVLVGGKRFVASGVGGATHTMDLTSMPGAFSERYEILMNGASSVYGSDAIAGVVNIIPKEVKNGGEINMQLQSPEIGEGKLFGLDAFWAKTTQSYSLLNAFSLSHQEAIKRTNLDYSRCDINPRITDQDGNGTIDNLHPDTGEQLCWQRIHGFMLHVPSGSRFRYEPSLAMPDDINPFYDSIVNGDLGIPYFTRASTGTLDNQGPYYRDRKSDSVTDLQTKNILASLMSRGSKAIEGTQAELYYELYFNQRHTVAGMPYKQFQPNIPAENTFNPFPVDLTAAIPGYALVEPTREINLNRIQTYSGLKYQISPQWQWHTYLGYGYSHGTERQDNYLKDAAENALNTVMDGDQVACANGAPNCTPLNLFSEDALLSGIFPDAAKQVIVTQTTQNTRYRSEVAATELQGKLYAGKDNPIQVAFGLEYNKESIDDKPDEQYLQGNILNSSALNRTRGKDASLELFTEVGATLVPPASSVGEVKANAALRYTKYDSFGGKATYRASAAWQASNSISLHASRGTSYRAPALFEQFLSPGAIYQSGRLEVDPCKDYQQRYSSDDPIFINCDGIGLPENFGNVDTRVQILIRGQSNLKAETSTAQNFALRYAPPGADVQLSVNYFTLNIKNTISNLPLSYTGFECYRSANLSSPFCDRFGPRNEFGHLTSFDASYVNIGEQNLSGAEVQLLAGARALNWNISAAINLVYLDEFEESFFDDLTDFAGHFGYSRWKGTMDLKLKNDHWALLWRAHWISNVSEDPVYDPDTTNIDRKYQIPNYFVHTLAAQYSVLDWKYTITAQNLLDKTPPIIPSGLTSSIVQRNFNTIPGAGYPMLGSTYVFKVSKSF